MSASRPCCVSWSPRGCTCPDVHRASRAQNGPGPSGPSLYRGVIWIYDFTHFRASKRCAVAIVDVVSRYWLSTVVSAEESCAQVEVAFTRALVADGKEHLLDEALLNGLAHGIVPDNDERVPVLLAVSDNGPQMTSNATAVFMAGARIAQHFGRPGTPERPSLDRVVFRPPQRRTPAPGQDPRPRRARTRAGPSAAALQHGQTPRRRGLRHPEDEHHGRGTAIRAARRAGLDAAHHTRVATRRQLRQDHP
jgi:putative transposase